MESVAAKLSSSVSKSGQTVSAPATAQSIEEDSKFWREYLAGSTLLPLDRIATLSRQVTDCVQIQKVPFERAFPSLCLTDLPLY